MKHNLSCILEEPTSMVSVNMLTHKVFLLSEYVQYWIVSTWIYTEEEKLISKINKIYILHTTMLARTQRTYKTYTLVSLLSWIYQRNLFKNSFLPCSKFIRCSMVFNLILLVKKCELFSKIWEWTNGVRFENTVPSLVLFYQY